MRLATDKAVPFIEPTPTTAAKSLANLGFLAVSDIPDRPGPAYLLIALRPEPTLRHYDPESVTFWATEKGRGRRERLTRSAQLPIYRRYSWGPIRITDRLGVTNDYLSFGGRLLVEQIGEDVFAVFTSPAPLLRRGGHSQGWDEGAECLGGWLGRVLLAVDYVPGFEAEMSAAEAVSRYAAFLADTTRRYRDCPALRESLPALWNLICADRERLRQQQPESWALGARLADIVGSATSGTGEPPSESLVSVPYTRTAPSGGRSP